MYRRLHIFVRSNCSIPSAPAATTGDMPGHHDIDYRLTADQPSSANRLTVGARLIINNPTTASRLAAATFIFNSTLWRAVHAASNKGNLTICPSSSVGHGRL